MRIIKIILIIMLWASVCAPLNAFAVSYPPAPLYHHEKSETVMAPGAIVYLFHSGTDEIKRAIHVEDVLTVYRINTSYEVREVGKIRVISRIGETYLKCMVMGGEIKENDIAKKGNISLLIISAGACNH